MRLLLSRRCMIWAVALMGCLFQAATAAPTAAALLARHCSECHGAKEPKADLRLDTLSEAQWADADLLDELVTRVADGEMPPAKAKTKLSPAERKQLLAALQPRLAELDRNAPPGTARKLTATEYSHTLEDLFGAPVERLSRLPFDSGHDLKKLGEHQVITSFAAQQYHAVAADYLDRNLLVTPPPVRTVTLDAKKNPKEFVVTSLFGRTPIGALTGQGNPPAFMVRSPVNSYAAEGEYELTLHWRAFYLPPGKRFDPEADYEPAKIHAPPMAVSFSDRPLLNPVQVQKGTQRAECRLDQPIRMRMDKGTKFVAFKIIQGAHLPPVTDDPRFRELEKQKLPKAEHEQAARALRRKIREEAKQRKKLCVIIHGATWRGPLNRKAPDAQKRLVGGLARDAGMAAVEPVLARHAARLFRRPVTEAELAPYLALARKEHDRTGNTYAAVQAALTGLLCSPHFLFKHEGAQAKLDDYAIAARLSYLFWNSGPDAELLQLARAGRLQDSGTRVQQALRLLEDRARTARFTGRFTREWLGLQGFDQYAPNEAHLSSGAFAALKPHLAAEPQAFFTELLTGNESALNFIDSGFVVWNQPLAGAYQQGGTRVRWPREADRTQFRRLPLDDNPNRLRGGLVTMGAILSQTTDGENTQPIRRGVWVARRLLGLNIEAPASVPAIEINLENVSKPREVLDRHKTDLSCAACHRQFDHLGLALEHYDVIGRWKTHYTHPVLNDKNRFELVKRDPIDARPQSPDGEALPGVAGLKQHLLARQTQVMRHLTETLFGYALGREPRFRDRPALDALMKEARKNDYRLRDLMLDLVASDLFIHR